MGRMKEIAMMRNDGMTPREIALELNVKESSIIELLRGTQYE
jgi:DNA-binding CsgD family transcriptional regulator